MKIGITSKDGTNKAGTWLYANQTQVSAYQVPFDIVVNAVSIYFESWTNDTTALLRAAIYRCIDDPAHIGKFYPVEKLWEGAVKPVNDGQPYDTGARWNSFIVAAPFKILANTKFCLAFQSSLLTSPRSLLNIQSFGGASQYWLQDGVLNEPYSGGATDPAIVPVATYTSNGQLVAYLDVTAGAIDLVGINVDVGTEVPAGDGIGIQLSEGTTFPVWITPVYQAVNIHESNWGNDEEGDPILIRNAQEKFVFGRRVKKFRFMTAGKYVIDTIYGTPMTP